MTKENLKKKYNHLKKLIDDDDYRAQYSKSLTTNEGLEINQERDKLIKADAQTHLNELVEKHPEVKEVKKDNSKKKKEA